MAANALRNKGPSRWHVAARVAAAIPANYVLTSLAAACIARLLPTSPAEASVAATLLSFALFALIALSAFGLRSLVRLWSSIGVAAAVMGGGLWLSIAVGGRL